MTPGLSLPLTILPDLSFCGPSSPKPVVLFDPVRVKMVQEKSYA